MKILFKVQSFKLNNIYALQRPSRSSILVFLGQVAPSLVKLMNLLFYSDNFFLLYYNTTAVIVLIITVVPVLYVATKLINKRTLTGQRKKMSPIVTTKLP